MDFLVLLGAVLGAYIVALAVWCDEDEIAYSVRLSAYLLLTPVVGFVVLGFVVFVVQAFK